MNVSLLLSKWGRRLGKDISKFKNRAPPEPVTNRWNIVKGDAVEVIQGPQTGQRGKVLDVIRKANRVIIEGVNMRERNVKSNLTGMPGKKVMKPCSIHYSNIMLIDPVTNKPTKISRRYLEDGSKVRISKASGQVIAKPDPFADRKPKSNVLGPKDTTADAAFAVTFPDYEKYLPFIYSSEKKA